MNPFPSVSAPGFETPLAFLKHCHNKIRQQLATMHDLLTPAHGATAATGTTIETTSKPTIEQRQAATAVLKYFDQGASIHHEDEEQNLMPMLQACAVDADARLLATLVPDILADHHAMDQAWEVLKVQLEDIGKGNAVTLSADLVERFSAFYLAHMQKEETLLAPMAQRLFSAQQMAQLGAAMQARRGIGGGNAGTNAEVAGMGSALFDLRKDYSQSSLMESDVLPDPFAQFNKWFEEALKAKVNEPNAMSVATVGPDGKPSSRIVLIKQYDARGFTWYTNYDSQKGRQLAGNDSAALLFFWPELERQVRIEGHVVKTADVESDHYFHSRPLKSRLAAIASNQSSLIASRAELEINFDATSASHGEQPPRPPQWGGYRLIPTRIEFWQGRRSRFHDRIVFSLQADGSWQLQRLQP